MALMVVPEMVEPVTRALLGAIDVLCRHPETPAQSRASRTTHALDEMDASMVIARRWVDKGCARATEDFDRFYAEKLPNLSEPSLRDEYLRIEEADLELAQRLEARHDLSEGSSPTSQSTRRGSSSTAKSCRRPTRWRVRARPT